MEEVLIDITKSSGVKVTSSTSKLCSSLRQSGAVGPLVEHIVGQDRDEPCEGISSMEIYKRAYAILKSRESVFACKYKLKKSIYELAPTGFPFKNFVAAILDYSGYKTIVGKTIPRICVTHEIDVLPRKIVLCFL